MHSFPPSFFSLSLSLSLDFNHSLDARWNRVPWRNNRAVKPRQSHLQSTRLSRGAAPRIGGNQRYTHNLSLSFLSLSLSPSLSPSFSLPLSLFLSRFLPLSLSLSLSLPLSLSLSLPLPLSLSLSLFLSLSTDNHTFDQHVCQKELQLTATHCNTLQLTRILQFEPQIRGTRQHTRRHALGYDKCVFDKKTYIKWKRPIYVFFMKSCISNWREPEVRTRIHTRTPPYSLSRIYTRIHSLSLARSLSFSLSFPPPVSLSLWLSLSLSLSHTHTHTHTRRSRGGEASAPAVNGCWLQSQIRNVGCGSCAGV